MRDRWLDEHVGGEAIVRPEFEASLGESLQTAWRQPSGAAAARRSTGPRRRTQVMIWAAAAAVLLVGGAVIARRYQHHGLTGSAGTGGRSLSADLGVLRQFSNPNRIGRSD